MGYFFGLLSPAIDAAVNYIDKFLLERYSISPTLIAIYSGVFAFLGGVFVVAFAGFSILSVYPAVLLVFSGILTILLFLPYFKALSLEEASRVGPLFQFVPIIVIILSSIFLSESLTAHQYLGAAIIVVAGFMLSLEKSAAGVFKVRKAFWYMLLACFLSASTVVLFKFGVSEVGFWQSIPYEAMGHGIGAIVILCFFQNMRSLQKETQKLPIKVFVIMSGIEILFIFSKYSGFYALSLLPASVVSILYGLQPLFIFFYGIILSLFFPRVIKEVITPRALMVKAISVTAMVVGLYIMLA